MSKYTLVKKTLEFSGRTLSLEVGRFAEQANAAVLAQYGDTQVLATVTASSKETSLDYFPLSVEYVERLYAGGRIKGSRWVKREGRPTDDAIFAGRVIDRSIRPLFPKSYKHDVQVIITLLSVDGVNDPDVLGACSCLRCIIHFIYSMGRTSISSPHGICKKYRRSRWRAFGKSDDYRAGNE